jgi:multiple sugar transport system ATP-binding protein
VVLGIRPDHVRVAEAEDPQAIKGRVFLVENLGMHSLVSIKVANAQGEPIVIRALFPPGQWANREIALALPPEATHWFDPQSGDALRTGG